VSPVFVGEHGQHVARRLRDGRTGSVRPAGAADADAPGDCLRDPTPGRGAAHKTRPDQLRRLLRRLGYPGRDAVLRFDEIPPAWLRALTKRWARWRLSTGTALTTVLADVRAITGFAQPFPSLQRGPEELTTSWAAGRSLPRGLSPVERRPTAGAAGGGDGPAGAGREPGPFPRPTGPATGTDLDGHRAAGRRWLPAAGWTALFATAKAPPTCTTPTTRCAAARSCPSTRSWPRPSPPGSKRCSPNSRAPPACCRDPRATSTVDCRSAPPPSVVSSASGCSPATSATNSARARHPAPVAPYSLGTRLINNEVPQETVRRLLDHASHQMTSHFARTAIGQDDPRPMGTRPQGQHRRRADPRGTGPLAEAVWMKNNLARAKMALPNGYCTLPLQQRCEYANACLSCPVFVTTPELLPQHYRQCKRGVASPPSRPGAPTNRATARGESATPAIARTCSRPAPRSPRHPAAQRRP